MRYRWKLLILLLTIALIPILMMTTLGARQVRLLGDMLVSQTREHHIADVESGLRLLVDSYAQVISSAREKLEMALMVQAKEVERFLAKDVPLPPKVYFAEDFNEGRDLPHDTILSPIFRTQPEGRISFLKISRSTQVFKLAPGAKREEVSADIGRLSAMTPIYESISKRLQEFSSWQYTSLANGLHSAYPGHAGIPASLDPKTRPWYRAAFERKVPWSDPYVDPETRQIVIAATMPVKRPNSQIAGVTAIVVPISRLLERRLLVRNIPPKTEAFMIYLETMPEAGQRGARIFARKEHTDISYRKWWSQISNDWLTSNDEAEFHDMITDLEAGKSNTRRMSYNGRDSLWAYGSMQNQASLVLITPYDEILKPADQAEENLQGLINNLVMLALYTMFGSGILVVVAAFAFSRTVTKPIEALVESARRLAKGDFDTQTEIRSRDELGEMGRVFNSVGPQLKEYRFIIYSLDLAKEVQQHFMPKADPKIEGLDIAGKSIYCDKTGGDYYDYLDIGEKEQGKIGVVVGDVSEHGIPSALLMATARAFLRQRSSMSGSIARIVSDVNRQMTRDVEETGRFMTLVFSEIDTQERCIRWVTAGHDPAIIYDISSDSFDELGGRGLPLGVFEDSAYRESRRKIAPGQIILIGTDGIWEAHNQQGEMFGKDALRRIIRAHANKPAREIIVAVLDAVEGFRSSREQEDDVTLVVIKVED